MSIVQINGRNFIMLEKAGGVMTICTKQSVANMAFGESTDFHNSDVLKYLQKEVLPELEYIIGKDNILPFETNLKAYNNDNLYLDITSRISLPTFDMYKRYEDLFDRFANNFWTATAYDTNEVIFIGYSAGAEHYSICKNVYPILKIKVPEELK